MKISALEQDKYLNIKEKLLNFKIELIYYKPNAKD